MILGVGSKRLFVLDVVSVVHPATRLHVLRIDPPERQLLDELRRANVSRAVQLSRSVIVQHRIEYARVTVEKVFRARGIVFGRVRMALRYPA